jgi:hypothetical protein
MRLAYPQRQLSKSTAHYKSSRRDYKEQNTFKIILERVSLRSIGKSFIGYAGQVLSAFYWIIVLHLFCREYISITQVQLQSVCSSNTFKKEMHVNYIQDDCFWKVYIWNGIQR